jgi:probable F420-dependent oxidoreductase
MKFWQALSFSDPTQLTEIAKIVEEVGFEGVLVSDHIFYPEKLESSYPYSPDGKPAFVPDAAFPECFSTITAMAAVTTKLRFSTMVYILPLRDPIMVAKATATAAVLSNERVALGVGAGWIKEEFDQFGIDFHKRGKLLDESIDVLRKLWKGGIVEHHGELFDFDRLEMSPNPRKALPILVGGISKPALRRAATRGDGWLGSGQTPEEGVEILRTLNQLRAEAGRENEPFETVCPLVTPPTADDFRRLEDEGCSGTVSFPFNYALGLESTIDEKRAYLEQYAENVIVPMG